jgi:tRNA A-37 threonylcarbamoyl transferase component Bud32
VDWFSDPARIHREALGLHWLAQLAPPGTIAPLIFEDRQHHLLAMQAVPQPHDNFKTLLLAGSLSSSQLLDLVGQFGQLLGTIHRTAYDRRAEIAPIFDDRSFFESLRLEPYYQYAAAQVPPASTFLTELIAQTKGRRFTLVHGDYSPKNVLVRHGRLVLLDHEVIHWGDPAFDVGFALTHLLSKARHLPASRRALAEAARAFWAAYLSALGRVPWDVDLEAMAVRHTLACMLARVAGRSPLEYLDAPARARQRDAVLSILQPRTTLPATIDILVDRLLEQP